MTTKAKDLERLERDYLASRQQIQKNPELSFEKRQLQLKALGDEYYARRRKLEEAA
jgi:lipase chaperone LimK